MKKQRGVLRLNELVAMGAEDEEESRIGTPAFSLYIPGIAEMEDAQWLAAKQRMVEEVRLWKEKAAESIRRSKLNDERSLILIELQHHRYDGEQVWTCGEATVTDAQLATMTDEEWAVVLARFHEEEERLSNVPAEPESMHNTYPGFDNGEPVFDLPLGVATEENPDFAPQMQAVHVAPVTPNGVTEGELSESAKTLIQDARFLAVEQNCKAFILPAGEVVFLAFGTAAQIRELLNGQ